MQFQDQDLTPLREALATWTTQRQAALRRKGVWRLGQWVEAMAAARAWDGTSAVADAHHKRRCLAAALQRLDALMVQKASPAASPMLAVASFPRRPESPAPQPLPK